MGPHRELRRARRLLVLLLIAIAVRLDRAAADRDALSSRASSSGAACSASYHLDRVGFRTQQVSNLVIGDPKRPDLDRALRPYPDAAQVGRQLRGLSDRRARRPAARPAGPRQGQLGPDRQAAPAAQQQAVRAAQLRARCCRQQHLAGDAVRSGRRCARRQRQAERRLQGPRGGRQPAAGARAAAPQPTFAPMSLSRWLPGVRRSTGRSPSTGFACPASRFDVVAPRFDAKASFNEAFTSVDGSGRMAITTPGRRRQRPRHFHRRHHLQGLARRRSTAT